MTKPNKLKAWIQGQKDASMSFVLEKALQKYLERYGSVVQLHVNTREGSAHLELLLKGESAPVSVSVDRYEVRREGERTLVVIQEIKSSREWLTLLLQEFATGRPLLIPEKYTHIARLLL